MTTPNLEKQFSFTVKHNGVEYKWIIVKVDDTITINGKKVTLQSNDEFFKDQKKQYDAMIKSGITETVARLIATLADWDYGGILSDEPKYSYFMEAIIIQMMKGHPIQNSYFVKVKDDVASSFPSFKTVRLPITGSEMSTFNFAKAVKSLN